jgi:hypothetical protein
LSNNSANVRTTKARIKSIEALHESPPLEAENDDLRLYVDEGRICIDFKGGKPNEDARKKIKSHAFKWSRYRSEWVRKATANAMHSAKYLLDELKSMESLY